MCSLVAMLVMVAMLVVCAHSFAQRVCCDRVNPHWFAGADGVTNHFWYRIARPGGKDEIVTINADTGGRKVKYPETEGEVDALSPLERPHPSADSSCETEIHFVNRLKTAVELFWITPEGKKISYGSIPAGGARLQHTYAGHVWTMETGNGTRSSIFAAGEMPGTAIADAETMRIPPPAEEPAPPSTASPDGKWNAFVCDDNLFLRNTASGAEIQLTTNASPHDTYARNADLDRGVGLDYDARDPETPTPEVYWSPDSMHLAAMRYRSGAERRVYLVDSAPPGQLQPKLLSYPYLKPGDAVPVRKPHLFDVAARRELPLNDNLFKNPWSIDGIHWEKDSSRFTFLFNQRGHQALRLLAVEASTGTVKPIIDEESRTFIDYSGKYFYDCLDASGEIIWMSERDGWNHLYLYDARTGAVKNQITKGPWVVRQVDQVDETRRQIWFEARGIMPGQNPYFIQFVRVNFDGTGLTLLTAGNGTHTALFSPDRRYLIDRWSRVDAPPVTDLRRSGDGSLVCHLESAEITGPMPMPQAFAARGRDGVTDIYGDIWLPAGFNRRKKYAVIEDIYSGPQDSYAPTAFHPSYEQQDLADHGFIVVQLDGMGTSNRSKKFHDVCWKNLRDAGLPDRVLWIKAAAGKIPAMDLSRVGIYGTSAGGQGAVRALLDYGDFYRAAVADSGCYDNRMDKIWWNEQWMGWPVDDGYARSSCVVDAARLRGRLLLLAGELDHNVDPASTMQLADALVKAGKDFDMFIMPGQDHGVLSTSYGWKKMEVFFMQNLGGPR
jgi:dipeptidyl aminopeptidase/acylaminoacyl peptidase